jgi:hypothetical protein
VRGKVFYQSVVCKLACLGQAVHTFAHLGIDIVIDNQGFKIVQGNDCLRQHVTGNADVFIVEKVAVQVEVLEIDGHELTIGCRFVAPTIRSPPAVQRTRRVLDFSGRSAHKTRTYMGFLCLGIFLRSMNHRVLVLVGMYELAPRP